MLQRVRSILRAVLRRERFERAMADELRFHLAARVDDLVASGVPRPDAERRARLEFGGVELAKDECRRARGLLLIDDVRQDLRYALRTLAKSPGFTAASIATLALGIGAVAIIYSVVHNVVIDPLPYRDARRLVNVFIEAPRVGVRGTFPVPELLDFRDQNTVFEDVIGTLGQGMTYEARDQVEYLRGVWVTPNFFDFMGLEPLHGRAIGADDGKPGAPAVAVLRHRAWLTYFAGDPAVVGSTVVLNGEPRTIVGIMPPRFTWHAADIWVAGPLDRSAPDAAKTPRNFQARLKPGVTVEQAAAELNVLAAGRARLHPQEYPENFRVQVVNVIEYTVGPFRRVLYTILAAVGLLLLIACCNVANMLLARATTREREMMIRAALGAGSGRIIRQLLIEGSLLAMCGAVLGCLVASVGIDALVARLPQNPLPGEVSITLNTPVLLVTLGIAVISAVLIGLAPALYAVRRDLVDGLKGAGGKGATTGRGRLRNVLVMAEIGLSLVLVLSAGLVMRSFVGEMRIELGFHPDNLLAIPLAFPPGRNQAAGERERFYRQAIDRLTSLPGVVAAAATSAIPPFSGGPDTAVDVAGEPGGRDRTAAVQAVTAEYFRALGIGFSRGAGFRDAAFDETPTLAVINETFARQYFGDRDPVGQSIVLRLAAPGSDPTIRRTLAVAGVVSDVKNEGLRRPARPHVYVPWSAASRGFPPLLVRTTREPAALVNTIRRELALLDRQVVVVQPRALPETLDRSFYAQPRFSLLVLGMFAATGTLLVAVGVFSVMAYAVSRQKKEIAVRIALGASRMQVCRFVLRLGVQLLAVGGTVGLLASFATGRLLSTQLWNVSTHDPLTVAAAVAFVSIVALTACYLPARRAMALDPLIALRDE